jgi:hypothetical protein
MGAGVQALGPRLDGCPGQPWPTLSFPGAPKRPKPSLRRRIQLPRPPAPADCICPCDVPGRPSALCLDGAVRDIRAACM